MKATLVEDLGVAEKSAKVSKDNEVFVVVTLGRRVEYPTFAPIPGNDQVVVELFFSAKAKRQQLNELLAGTSTGLGFFIPGKGDMSTATLVGRFPRGGEHSFASQGDIDEVRDQVFKMLERL